MIINPLKNCLFPVFIIFLIFSCSPGKIDSHEARNCAEGYLEAVKAGDNEAALKFYSSQFDEADAPEKRLDKLKQLVKVMGPITTYELTDSAWMTEGDFPAMMLTYKIKHNKINSIEKFAIIKDEGNYKIASHDIKSDN